MSIRHAHFFAPRLRPKVIAIESVGQLLQKSRLHSRSALTASTLEVSMRVIACLQQSSGRCIGRGVDFSLSDSMRCKLVPRALARIAASSSANWTPSPVPIVLIQICVSSSATARRAVPSMQSAARFSGVLPSDSLHRFGGRVVRNGRIRLHETRPRLAVDRMAVRFGGGFHCSRIHSSSISSEAGASRPRQHMVEVNVSRVVI